MSLEINLLNFIGYILLAFIASGIAISRTLRYRWYFFFLSAGLAVYGFAILDFIIGAAGLTAALLCFALIQRMHNKKEYFRLFEVDRDSKYLLAFMEYYYKEINKFVPYFTYEPNEKSKTFVLLRNMAVIGVFITKMKNESTLMVKLDFVIPEFRDFRMGRHIYSKNLRYFHDLGYSRFENVSLNKEYDEYLLKMGFREDNSTGQRLFVKEIIP